MRTLEGLANAIAYNTIPTIGERVWNKIIAYNLDITDPDWIEQYSPIVIIKPNMFSPNIDFRNRQLSIDFFKQMDELGKQVYTDWKK